jgi:hypothetical protein
MLAACSKSAEAYAAIHPGEPPPTTAGNGIPEVNGMEPVVGPECQTGYAAPSQADQTQGTGEVSAVRLQPSPDGAVVGYLVAGISGWLPASDYPKYDLQTLHQAEQKLEAEPPPAGAITRPGS